MPPEISHKAWLSFLRKAADVAQGYSEEHLRSLRRVASHEYPSIVPVIEGYIELARRSETDIPPPEGSKSRSRRPAEMHLFDLLREKRFFPTNSDLARFAARVVPDMRAYRFDKMSRSDIAARVIEYLENSDPRARDALEKSMREALAAMKKPRHSSDADRRSFLSKWERIIKGLEL